MIWRSKHFESDPLRDWQLTGKRNLGQVGCICVRPQSGCICVRPQSAPNLSATCHGFWVGCCEKEMDDRGMDQEL